MKRDIKEWLEAWGRELGIEFPPSAAKRVIWGFTLVLASLFFIDCLSRGGSFATGIVYAGYGVFGLACLGVTCASASCLAAIITLWLLNLTPNRRPRKVPLGLVILFLVWFEVGLARHLPDPVLGEMVLGAASALFLYLSLFVQQHPSNI